MKKAGNILGVLALGIILAVGIRMNAGMGRPAGVGAPKADLTVRIDREGPYLILASDAALADYAEALLSAKRIHPEAEITNFDPSRPESARGALERHHPRYVMVVLKPEELDALFAWAWIRLAASLDNDPFLDTRTGFITGESPAAATAFIKRILDAAEGRLRLPGMLIDNLGPNSMAEKTAWYKTPGAFMVPCYEGRFGAATISHGAQGFARERLGEMDGAGFIHYGGHGYPDRVVDSLNGVYVRKLKLAPCVFFNGACYTGVTDRWYEFGARVKERRVDPKVCFCLGVLANNAIAYLAALHPDHGIPVYQEMERLAYTGASLGEIMRGTHDTVILASGASPFEPPAIKDGMISPAWGPAEVMLFGTASRVLFGDPAMIPVKAFSEPPFTVTTHESDGSLEVRASVQNTRLKSTFADTFASDMSETGQFNARACLVIDLPPAWGDGARLANLAVQADGKVIPHRLVALAVEREGNARRLHVHVDARSTGYLESPLQRAGATISCRVTRVPKNIK
jgi:hypothetical protein